MSFLQVYPGILIGFYPTIFCNSLLNLLMGCATTRSKPLQPNIGATHLYLAVKIHKTALQ